MYRQSLIKLLNTTPMKSPALEWILAFAFACGVAIYAAICFDGADQFYRLWYYTPAALVVGSLMVDRCKNPSSEMALVILDPQDR